MNYRRTIVLGLVLALALPTFVSAQGAGASLNATVTPTNVRANIDLRRASSADRREERRENIDERRASATAKRIEVQQNIAKRQVEHVSKVMLATIERLEKIIARIESRIAKLEAEGRAAGESKEFVAEAKANLSDAKLKVATFSSIDLTSVKAQENFQRIRAAAAEARELIKEARENLMKAIRSLVSGRTSEDNDSDSGENE